MNKKHGALVHRRPGEVISDIPKNIEVKEKGGNLVFLSSISEEELEKFVAILLLSDIIERLPIFIEI